ncbi:MAG: hypothetical protein KBS95_07040 [Alistipes sp.]|nr:hypothetical protein [Candidatus Alistipes equi]
MRVGENQFLIVSRVSDYGLYLKDDSGEEVLLPNRFVSLQWKQGDSLEVFVYHDSEDRIVASTEKPLVEVGNVAFLEVVDKNQHGAFLDWGMSGKNLFLPNRNQKGAVRVGERVFVTSYVDERTGRAVATQKLKPYVNNESLSDLKAGQKVSVLVASRSELGFRAIIENKHWGMLYHNQIFQNISVGDRLEAYISRITEDNRIDLSLQRSGLGQVKDSSEQLYQIIQQNGGVLEVGDASSPEDIQRLLHMSKKLFKRSLGMLLSHNRVTTDGKTVTIIKK